MGQNESTPGCLEDSLTNPHARPSEDSGHAREAADGQEDLQSDRRKRLQEELDIMRVMLSSLHDEGGELRREIEREKLWKQEQRSQRAIYIRQRQTELEELKQSLEMAAAATQDHRKSQRARDEEKTREEKGKVLYEKLRLALGQLETEHHRTTLRESLEEEAELQREQEKRAKIAQARVRCSQLEEMLREADRRANERERARKLELHSRQQSAASMADGHPQRTSARQSASFVRNNNKEGSDTSTPSGEAGKSGGMTIPLHYQIRMSKTWGKPYYLNTLTGACTWEIPREGAMEPRDDSDVIIWQSNPAQGVQGRNVEVEAMEEAGKSQLPKLKQLEEVLETLEKALEKEKTERLAARGSAQGKGGGRRLSKAPRDGALSPRKEHVGGAGSTSGTPRGRGRSPLKSARRGETEGSVKKQDLKQDEVHSKEKGKSLPDRKDGACPDKTQVFDSLQTRDLVNSNLGTIASPRQDRERSRGREGNIGQVENSTDSTKATSSSHPSCSKSAQGRAVSKVPNKEMTKERTWEYHLEWIKDWCPKVNAARKKALFEMRLERLNIAEELNTLASRQQMCVNEVEKAKNKLAQARIQAGRQGAAKALILSAELAERKQELELENKKRGFLLSRLQEIYDDCPYIAKAENPNR